MYKHFEEIAEAAKHLPVKGRIAVAGAADKAVLESVLEAFDSGITVPVLVGEKEEISSLLAGLGRNPDEFEIVHASKGEEGPKAVELVREGKASVLMKGMIETSELLRPVVNRETGLRTGSVMSHVGFFDRVPGTDHFIIQTDGGMLLYPDLKEKKAIIENAVSALHAIGNDGFATFSKRYLENGALDWCSPTYADGDGKKFCGCRGGRMDLPSWKN